MSTPEPQPAPVHDGRRLDWFRRLDPRSLSYPVAAGPDTALPTRGRLWPAGRILDQGREGACVGAGCVAEAAAEPVPVPGLSMRNALAWYRSAQRRDQWPGEAYDGTSVLAGCLEGRARQLYAGFLWAKRAEQLAAGIVAPEEEGGGPAIIGVEWTEGAYETDTLGVLRPSGAVVGGHCVCVLGFVPADLSGMSEDDAAELLQQLEDVRLGAAVESVLADGEAGAFIVQNSWGLSFGKNGLCVVPLSVMGYWARTGWEAAQPQGRTLPGRKGTAVTAVPEDLEQNLVVEPVDESVDPDDGDTTLHILATQVLEGDRILDPPDELGQESVTVRGTPRLVLDHRGRRVVVNSRVGTFTLNAGAAVTVRRQQ